ncbi:MAG: hypothetical protein C5B50_08525 [Verrucomicrobia bacterium]|nr:MAG: hypothetical protein C5B50_08525 [Verrucomicrobiota bacterium]
MKTNSRNSLIITGLCAIALSFASAVYAEKGAERLATFGKSAAPTPTQVATAPMHRCPSCSDVLVNVVDKGTKGPNFATSKVVRHTCAACDVKIVTAGTGKAKQNVALHTCNAELNPACCAKN